MMLIIMSPNAHESADLLVANTNKSFVFKQTLELAQLICSSGFSKVYKKINQAKELKEWIKYYDFWTQCYFSDLVKWCEKNVNLSQKTINDWYDIRRDMLLNNNVSIYKPLFPTTAIWRYSKDYKSEYPTNSELPIDVVCELYKKYITEFKFKKSEAWE